MEREPEARVFTIPPGLPFLPTLADALVEGRLGPDGAGAEDLAEATIYLPTRRAVRAFATFLAERVGARACLLPRLVALGETEEAAAVGLADEAGGLEALVPDGAIAPPIAPLERRLILTRLVQRWSAEVDRTLLRLGPGVPFLVPASPADAVNLAGDLEGLMDALATEDVPWDDLAAAVEAEYSEYFRITLEFVRLAARNWPRILDERGASDPTVRWGALIRAEARRLRRERPGAMVVAAGSTGSVPATAELLSAIARLPRGAVVLPGLDTDLDEASWGLVGEPAAAGDHPAHGHPQAALRRLVERHLGCGRAGVRTLGEAGATARARARAASEALRPADTTDRWAAMPASERAALAARACRGLALIEAADEREEALCVAIALREALERPGRTAALVTPDRALAARVVAELRRWGVTVEDSAGCALAETPVGRLARLAADAAADDFRPARLLALLAHPLVRLGVPRPEIERAAGVLEIGVLRGPAPGPGLGGIRYALEGARGVADHRTPRPRRRLTQDDWALAADLLDRLEAAFAGFPPASDEGGLNLAALAEPHRRTVDALASRKDADEEMSEDEAALASLFDDLALASETGRVEGRFADYPLFFATLARAQALHRPPQEAHRRVKILGLLEAHLLHLDRVVLGGLDEGVWPPRVETDAFLNRPMRAAIGLSPPERRIGQTAHDFAQGLGAEEAIITRAAKRGNKPMVPSRFLQRLRAFLGEAPWAGVAREGERYRALAHALEASAPAPALRRPAPRPGAHHVPKSLSVTEIETLVRDPYAIFARHILKLDALEPVANEPGAASRGTIIHGVLGDFAAAYPVVLPDDALARLRAFGRRAFAEVEQTAPELFAEWWPRFETLAVGYIEWERERRGDLLRVYPECSGSLAIPLPGGGTFTLRARADRIEARRDGFAIIDFKTGKPPSNPVVFVGFSPQLTLEAAMLMRGAFKGVPAATATPELLYVHTSGGRVPLSPCPVKPPKGEARSVASVIDEHLDRLTHLLARYATGEAAYPSRPYPQYARAFSEYDHLARVREWSMTGAEGEAG